MIPDDCIASTRFKTYTSSITNAPKTTIARTKRNSTEIIVIAFASLIISSQYYFASGDDLSPTVYASAKINDKFGVLEIYPTANKGETWFFNSSFPIDGQFDRNEANITRNSDGSWHVAPGITRMLAFTKSSGEPSDAIRSNLSSYNYSQLSQTGYWYKPTDWKNVEITGYFKPLAIKEKNDISLVSRSVRHSTNVYGGCGGSSYHNNIGIDNGAFRFKKEMWHADYERTPYFNTTIGSIMNKWTGFKGIVYNLANNSVKLESYVDKDANNQWFKVAELVDSGKWGNDMMHCNAKTQGAVISWGSPMIIFKSDNVTYDFKNLSVREITPPI
jgi:hypothetical protein